MALTLKNDYLVHCLANCLYCLWWCLTGRTVIQYGNGWVLSWHGETFQNSMTSPKKVFCHLFFRSKTKERKITCQMIFWLSGWRIIYKYWSHSGINAGGGASVIAKWAVGTWLTFLVWKSLSMRQSITNNSALFFWSIVLGFSFAISSFSWDGVIPEKFLRIFVGLQAGKIIVSDDEDDVRVSDLCQVLKN